MKTTSLWILSHRGSFGQPTHSGADPIRPNYLNDIIMTSSSKISDLQGIMWNFYFQKANYKSYLKIWTLLILDRYFKRHSKIDEIWQPFGMGHYQIWSYYVTRGKKLSYLYLISYSPSNVTQTHQILWFSYIPNRIYKENNLRAGRICPPPPPPPQCGIGLRRLGKRSSWSEYTHPLIRHQISLLFQL